MTINPFAGRGVRRYTRKHLRHDRDAARSECQRLKERLQRSAQTNRRLNEEKEVLDGQVRDLTQQLDVSATLVATRDKTIRELKNQLKDPAEPGSESTQNIPRADLPQDAVHTRSPRPSWERTADTVELPVLADRLVQGATS